MNLQPLLAAASCVLLASCASIVLGSDGTVEVLSEPPGARFRTNTGSTGTTPSTITVPNSVDLVVNYSHPGYEPSVAHAPARMSAWVAGNLLFGGLIGLVIDIANDDARTHDDTVMAVLVPEPMRPPVPSTRPVAAPGAKPPVWTGGN